MNEGCEEILFSMIKFAADATLVVLGAYLVYFFGLKAGKQLLRKKSLHDIADAFARQAAELSEQSFGMTAGFMEWHRGSVYVLSPHADYVEQAYAEQWNLVKPYWDYYRCYPDGIQASAYLERNRSGLVRSLYKIADILRDA